MNKTLLILTILTLGVLTSCLEDEPKAECNESTLAVAATATVDGEPYCYTTGSLVYEAHNDLLHLDLYVAGDRSQRVKVAYSIPAQGYQFDVSYSVVSGEYSESVPVKSGTILLQEDNFPTDPTLMQYAGEFDLQFQSEGSPTVISISGNFSFEKP